MVENCQNSLRRRWQLMSGVFLALVLSGNPAHPDAIEPLDDLLDSVDGYLRAQITDADPAAIEIVVGKVDDRLRLTRCDDPPEFRMGPGARLLGPTTVNIRCAQPVAWSILVPAEIRRYAEVVVLARHVPRDHVIRRADLAVKRTETSVLVSGYLENPERAIGMETRRSLTSGQVLSTSHLNPRQIVKRGQLVTIYAESAAVNVRMQGEALEDGVEGQRIRIRNRSSRRIIEGIIDVAGNARVPF